MEKKNNKGFTLIEILAVIVILGILLLIAVPSVSKYIMESRKKSITTSIESYVKSVKTEVDSKKYSFKKSDVIYALPVECIPISANNSNIFKKIVRASEDDWAYVLIQYNQSKSSYIYGFVFNEKDSWGMYPRTIDNISRKGKNIETNLDLNFPTNGLYSNLTDESNWSNSGFNLTETTTLHVLKSANYGVKGDGKDTCTLLEDDGTVPDEDEEEETPIEDPEEEVATSVSAIYLKGSKINNTYPKATTLSEALINNGLKITLTYEKGNVYEFKYCKNDNCTSNPTTWYSACTPTDTNKTNCTFNFEQDFYGYLEFAAFDSSGNINGLTSNKFFTNTDVTAPIPTLTINETTAGQITVTSSGSVGAAQNFTVKEDSSINFTVTSNESNTTQKLLIDSVEYDATNKTITKVLSVGEHTVQSLSTDEAENTRYSDSAIIIVEAATPPSTEDGEVEEGEVCNNRIENSICYFDLNGKTPENFATLYSKNQSGTAVYDFDVTIQFTTSGVNWQCYTGSNKGFNWFGQSLFGGYRCWEGSVCYENLITKKGQTINGSASVKDCSELVNY